MQKVILITGATAGFGRSCAYRFASAGWRLILIGRRHERLAQLQKELSAQTPVLTIPLDIRQRAEVFKRLENLPDEFRPVDVLVNNAGLALGLEPFGEGEVDNWENMIDTNIKGLLYVTRAILPGMIERNSGQIINLGSIAGNWSYPGGNVYGASKAFVNHLSRNLRADLYGKAIRVTCIEPGLAETEFSLVRFKGDQKRARQVYEGCQPLTSEDIAEMIYWVANLPPHVNVNSLEVMPTSQTWGNLRVFRQ